MNNILKAKLLLLDCCHCLHHVNDRLLCARVQVVHIRQAMHILQLLQLLQLPALMVHRLLLSQC